MTVTTTQWPYYFQFKLLATALEDYGGGRIGQVRELSIFTCTEKDYAEDAAIHGGNKISKLLCIKPCICIV